MPLATEQTEEFNRQAPVTAGLNAGGNVNVTQQQWQLRGIPYRCEASYANLAALNLNLACLLVDDESRATLSSGLLEGTPDCVAS
jgi:hypothetical protein